MNKILLNFYIIVAFFSNILFLSNLDLSFKDKVNKALNIKYIILWFTIIFHIYSLYKTNKYINKYILPAILCLNLVGLLLISLCNNELTFIHILSMIGLVYLLVTFNYKDFEVIDGFLLKENKANKLWIYLYILFIIVWYLSSSYIFVRDKIICTLLILYPLLFPIKEFFFHRVLALSVAYFVLNINKIKI